MFKKPTLSPIAATRESYDSRPVGLSAVTGGKNPYTCRVRSRNTTGHAEMIFVRRLPCPCRNFGDAAHAWKNESRALSRKGRNAERADYACRVFCFEL